MTYRSSVAHFGSALLVAAILTTGLDAQGTRRFQCSGYINGVSSEALLEVAPGGLYTEGPGVAGRIRNRFADYSFSGILFGGTQGFVSLVELRTRERIHRVWIGVLPT